MVQIGCDCEERYGIEIDSYNLFEELKSFFEEQVSNGVFKEIPVTEPFYIGYSEVKREEVKWYATKWYKCEACGCLWEFDYPDFPSKGFVRKLQREEYSCDKRI